MLSGAKSRHLYRFVAKVKRQAHQLTSESAIAPSFDDLHDATLVTVNFTWKTGEIDIHLRTASNPDFHLNILNATAFHATRNFEWGLSEQINSVTVSEKSVVIELQSGDTIKVIGHVEY